jgi:hypothetical protein
MLRIGYESSVGDKALSIIGGSWCPLGGVVSQSEILSSLGKYVSVCGKQGSEDDSACSSRCKGRDMVPVRCMRSSPWSWRLKWCPVLDSFL